MKTRVLSRICVVVFMLIAGQTMWAQEAFYIYRNDGDFNGFFYDDVKSMRLSKIDLDLTERDEYVVQEIETKDTIYRIPLCAIDSIGFQQQEIILSNKLQVLYSEDCPYKIRNGVRIYPDNVYAICWQPKTEKGWVDGQYTDYVPDEYLPKKGDIIYYPYWGDIVQNTNDEENWPYEKWLELVRELSGPFVGKVKEVIPHPDEGLASQGMIQVVCEPIEEIGEVFEQLITVEQIGWENGSVSSRRFAGEDKVYVRASGNKELTLVNLNGTFPLSYGNDDFSATLGIDVALSIKANVSYKVTLSDFNVNVTIKEDAEVGVSFTAKANLGETTTWHLAGVPIYFPSFLPIFQLDPSPQAFIKTAGDLSLKVSTPKFAYHGQQTIHMGLDGVYIRADKNNGDAPGKEGNGWSMELSLNGSIHAGSNYPIKLESNHWVKKFVYAAIGADVYSGPKLSASFTLDPVALIADKDIYNTFKNTQIKFSPLAVAFEASGEYSIRNKEPKKKATWFNSEITFGDITLKLFPEFEETKVTEHTQGTQYNYYGQATVATYPRGNSVPFVIGAGLYNEKRELCESTYADISRYNNWMTYSFFNTFDEGAYKLSLLDGIYKVVPIISIPGLDRPVPVWDAEVELEHFGALRLESISGDRYSGTFSISGLMEDDIVEFELVEGYLQESWSVDGESHHNYTSIGAKVFFTEKECQPGLERGVEKMVVRTYEFENYLTQWNTVNSQGYLDKAYSEHNRFRIKVSRGKHVRYLYDGLPGWVFYPKNLGTK